MIDKNNSIPKIAVALHYDGESTPTVTSKGVGELAEQIIAIAKQHGVHIHEDPLLLEYLARLQINNEIPELLYKAVAEVIAFAYILNGKWPRDWNQKQSV